MGRNLLLAGGLMALLASTAWADGFPFGGGSRRFLMEAPPHNFAIERDQRITKAMLFIPSRMLGDGKARTEARPGAVPVGVSMAGCFAFGGLWPAGARRRLLLGVAVPLVLAVATATVWANIAVPIGPKGLDPKALPAALVVPREVDVYVDHDCDHVRLILPAPAP